MARKVARPNVLHGRCACGRRYRILNARARVTVTCPECGRAIIVTEADLRAAAAGVLPLAPLQSDSEETLEAIPLDEGIGLARRGSRPGATGEVIQTDESLLHGLGRWRPGRDEPPPSADELAVMPGRELRSGFLADLFASFYLAGKWQNVVGLLAFAAAMALCHIAIPFLLFRSAVSLLLLVYTIQFFWSTLSLTAAGEERIPIVPHNWSLWEDAILPTFWLACVTTFCLAPTWLAARFGPVGLHHDVVVAAALLLGSFFWPVAVMSVALGQSLGFLRPDWLVRCIIGIGPLYIVAWLLTALAVVACVQISEFLTARTSLLTAILFTVLGVLVELYFGYVIFRTIGVLFRYYRHRLPWKF